MNEEEIKSFGAISELFDLKISSLRWTEKWILDPELYKTRSEIAQQDILIDAVVKLLGTLKDIFQNMGFVQRSLQEKGII